MDTFLSGTFLHQPTFRLILYSLAIAGLTLVIIKSQLRVLVATRKKLREKEQALELMESKSAELEFKNKRITDSLVYAKRIQEALLPSEVYLKKWFPESFIFYKPKDIVSGDFYWIGRQGGKYFMVAADCTGHGVPGALMSMIGHDLLEKIVIGEGVSQPADILGRINKSLEETFTREKNVGTIMRDGMDMGICSIDLKAKKIEYSGSFFPLYLIRDDHLMEFKGDKSTLGMAGPDFSYTNNEIELQKNDTIYMFSDGYADQFGGEENKKFMYRRFRYLLVNIHKFPMADQKSILEENINTWMGNTSQIDDILVMGIRPL
ncbi:MAG: SpoIIE family protein phosphatase [Bacteroidales bacterium]